MSSTPKQINSITVGERGMVLRTPADFQAFAETYIASGFAPRGVDTPAKVIIAIQRGMELGFSPGQAIDTIAVINNRPCLWGDGLQALILASGLCENFEEYHEGDGDAYCAVCRVKRRGMADWHERRFSVADAKKAGLWGKAGPWQQYPKRMMQMRARSWACRDVFADVLKGISVVEEVADYEAIESGPRPPRRIAPAAPQRLPDVAGAAPTLDDPIGEPFEPPAEHATEPQPQPAAGARYISEAQRKRLFAIAHEVNAENKHIKQMLADEFGIGSTTEIPIDKYDAVIEQVRKLGGR